MQLDCALRSLSKNVPKPDYLTVIYKSTNEEFQKGYDKLLEDIDRQIEYGYYANMVRETNFKQNVLDSLLGDYTLFLTDDDIVFKPIEFIPFDNLACFSYRLGKNIDFCYSNNKPNTLKSYKEEGSYLTWPWRQEELDFGYPLSVTAHLFKTSLIKALTERIDFKNPNEYEGMLQRFVSELPPIMSSYKDSRVVGVPANRVNDTHPNRNALTYSYTTKELNDRFLRGERIDFERMSYPVHGAQQELQYLFTR